MKEFIKKALLCFVAFLALEIGFCALLVLYENLSMLGLGLGLVALVLSFFVATYLFVMAGVK